MLPSSRPDRPGAPCEVAATWVGRGSPIRTRPEVTMAQLLPDEPDEPDAQFHRDRSEHAGAPEHLDDDQLARLAEEERVAAALDDYDPDEVPPATDEPSDPDLTQ